MNQGHSFYFNSIDEGKGEKHQNILISTLGWYDNRLSATKLFTYTPLCLYNAIQFNSTTNYTLQNDHKVELTPPKRFQQKLNIITFMKGGFIAGL